MVPNHRNLHLTVLAGDFAIVRLPASDALPSWAVGRPFLSVTRTAEELSIVILESQVPASIPAHRGWRALMVHGPFLLSEVGVLASLASPLAAAGLSLFVISTFDTDYLFLSSAQLAAATVALRQAGHTVFEQAAPQ